MRGQSYVFKYFDANFVVHLTGFKEFNESVRESLLVQKIVELFELLTSHKIVNIFYI